MGNLNNIRKTNERRNNLLESIMEIDFNTLHGIRSKKNLLDRLVSLTEAYYAYALESGSSMLINEAKTFMSVTEKTIVASLTVRRHVNEGFYNPFDDGFDEQEVVPLVKQQETPDDGEIKIGKVRLWSERPNNVSFKDGRMFAGTFFAKGDTVEVCPVRILANDDLYSRNVRDFAFLVDEDNHTYAIPFGYASFYRNSKECNVNPNLNYEYVNSKENPCIRIFATKNIRKGHEMVLFAEESDFENEINPSQFKYDTGTEPFVAVKNVVIA